MDGFNLYNQLRKVDPDIKILFLTASEKNLDTFSKDGYRKDLFLIKPVHIQDLVKEVNLRLRLCVK